MTQRSNLFLVGPMGAGKSTVGRQLAGLLEMPFVDLDHEIEVHTGAKIALIFDVEGEAGFRQRESAALAEWVEHEGIVLATGGGAVLVEENRNLLRSRGLVIWIDTSIDVQLQRLARSHQQRPLLAAPDRRERLEQLARERSPLYREIADITIASSGHGQVSGVAKQIATLVQQRWQSGAPIEASA